MSSRSPSRSGGCLCGAIRFTAGGEPRAPCLCHCETCRRASGAPVVGWVSFPRSGLTFTRGEPRIYVSSQKAHRGFCPSCGTQLLYQLEADPEWVDVTLVSLDEPEQILPEAHVWTSERLSWLQPGDTLPRHASDRERERE